MLLITWRQKLLSWSLTFIVLVTLLGGEQSQILLEGWWYTEQIQAYCPKKLVTHKFFMSPNDLKIIEIWKWMTIAFLGQLSVILFVMLLPHSGPTWLLLFFSSHKLMALWRHERDMWIELVHQQGHSVLEAQANIVLPRQVSTSEDKAEKGSHVENNIEKNSSLKSPEEEIVNQLAQLVIDLPIGTNLGLFHFLWMLVSGHLLASRGAIFPALQATGLPKEAVRRAWKAFGAGSWRIETLLAKLQDQVISQGEWKEHCHEGYRPKAVDLTAFWRPTLQICKTKHYYGPANRALPAIVLGVATRVGQVGSQRVPLPSLLIRFDENDPTEKALKEKLLKKVCETLEEDEVAIFDAGFKISQLHEIGIKRYIVRLAINFVGRRNYLPEYKKRGTKPKYGQQVRPLARRSKKRLIEATPPDRVESWSEKEYTCRCEIWEELVLNADKPGARTFNVYAIHDSRYKKPLLLASSLFLNGTTIKALYEDRWPVEQLPLCAKQMIGAHRQFVFSDENCQRLPEVSLLAGSVLTYVAATLPPIPTGFWDRAPKATPGRLRRYLNYQSLTKILSNFPLPTRIRKKASRTSHLRKGVLGHRRRKSI